MAIDNKYTATDRLCDLIDDNFKLLMVMSRFGISLGFGEKSVKEVCEAENVDCDTFLA
ncbi:MAG: hemerythrin domain-containing protein, partial [Bacteroidales bacterium]|nr:hemerythrin domain-containing protein [Bacteroidales bacterium]